MKKLLGTLAAVFAAVAIAVLLKNQYGTVFSGTTYGMQTAVKMEKIDHLFIGSSMFRQGMDIDVLEEQLDGNVYILSYNGNQPVFMAKELEYLLEQGVKIKNLYVDFYAYTLTAVPWISDTKLFLDTDLGFKMDAWKLMRTYSDAGIKDFYEMFVTANNEQILMYPVNERIVASQFRNGGSLLMLAGKTKEELDEMDLGVRDGLYEEQLEGYEQIAELAEQNDINLLFVETPKYEKLLKDTREGSYTELYEAMKAWAEQRGVSYLSADEVSFDHTDAANFQDLIHLSGQGRKIYCGLLAEAIKRN